MDPAGPSLEALLRGSAVDAGVDRKALASLFLEAARSIDRERAAAVPGLAPADPRVEELRRLLVGAEIDQLGRISRRVEDPEQLADAVGRVLPSALAQASNRDERLGQVLAPTLERATQASIRGDPRTFVNILYPVILPAIRKSIAETIEGSVQSLNESLRQSLSWQGLKWRIEAWRTGSSFAETVLRHTLVYQVEHVFLIHRHTGLLITHVTAEDAASQDPQLVSSMLVAIQDFVRDSFSGGAPAALDTLRLGDLRLWSEQGPYATLVAVIRGTPPESLHERLREVLAAVHAERAVALEAFAGDSAPFADVSAQLEPLVRLRQEARPGARRASRWRVALLALVVLGAVGAWAWRTWDERTRWDDYVARLQAEPGIVVASAGRRDGKWTVTGLRDPLAADPWALLAPSGIDPAAVVANWQPYQALNAPIVLKRLQGALDPPPTITLEVRDGAIVASGESSFGWLHKARAVTRTLPLGAPRVDLGQVRDLAEGELGRLRDAIQRHSIRFDYNEAIPTKGQDAVFDELAELLKQLVSLSSTLRVSSRVTVTGHSDTTGKGVFNLSLSTARAEVVRAFLRKRGVDPDLLAVRGAGPLEPLNQEQSEVERTLNRRVSFSVAIDE